MIIKKNISRDDISETIYNQFGYSRKECLLIVNDIIDIIIEGLETNGIIKIHNFGTFKLKRKNSRIGRNPKTKQEVIIQGRNVITFKASKNILKFINSEENEQKVS